MLSISELDAIARAVSPAWNTALLSRLRDRASRRTHICIAD
jgi:hypothetical protein